MLSLFPAPRLISQAGLNCGVTTAGGGRGSHQLGGTLWTRHYSRLSGEPSTAEGSGAVLRVQGLSYTPLTQRRDAWTHPDRGKGSSLLGGSTLAPGGQLAGLGRAGQRWLPWRLSELVG